MGGKKLAIALAVCFGLILSIILWRNPDSQRRGSLRICTWSNYFPDSFLDEFTHRTGIRVEVSYMSSNEELLAKLKAGASGYDIVFPSDYMVKQMVALEMLAPLDKSLLPNLAYIERFYSKMDYDIGFNHSVPYTWGIIGIAVNTKAAKIPEGPASWKWVFDSFDPKHTSLMDDMMEVFSAALLYRGKDPSDRTLANLEAAKADIHRAKEKILMFTSEPKPLLLSGELTVAQLASTDAAQVARENPDVRFFVPQEGADLYVDNFALPRHSPMQREAHVFINFFTDPEVAYRLNQENRLNTANKIVRERLKAAGQLSEEFYPSEELMHRLHLIQFVEESLLPMNRMWTELKS